MAHRSHHAHRYAVEVSAASHRHIRLTAAVDTNYADDEPFPHDRYLEVSRTIPLAGRTFFALPVPATPFPSIRGSTIALAGICSYLLSLTLPSDSVAPLALLACCACVAALRNLHAPTAPQVKLLFGLATAFVLASVLSAFGADDPGRSLRLSMPLLPALLVFLAITYLGRLRDLEMLYVVLSIFALALACGLLYAGSAMARGPAAIVTGLGSPMLLVPNDCVVLAVLAPFTLALTVGSTRSAATVGSVVCLLASFTAILVLQSRMAALIFVASLTAMSWSLLPRRWRFLVPCTCILAFVAIDGMRGFPLLAKFASLRDARIALWILAVEMAADAPWLGHGPHTYGVLRPSYLSAGAIPSWLPVDDRAVPWAHNLYLEALAEQGVIGLLALLALLSVGLVVAYRTFAAATGRARSLSAGPLVALAGFCAAGTVELSFIREWVVIILFVVLGIIARSPSLAMPEAVRAHQ